jgi:hypothetical protein
MNPVIIDRLEIQSESSNTFKSTNECNNANGNKARRTATYWRSETARQHRNQEKVRHETFKHTEQPNEEDVHIENINICNMLRPQDVKIVANNANELQEQSRSHIISNQNSECEDSDYEYDDYYILGSEDEADFPVPLRRRVKEEKKEDSWEAHCKKVEEALEYWAKESLKFPNQRMEALRKHMESDEED